MQDNPFVYGEIVPRAAFVDREAELDRLTRDLAAGQKVFLISPRRYGKSSLIRRALDAVSRDGTATVEVTVASFSSYVTFLEGYARALVAVESRPGRVGTWLRELFVRVKPEVRVEAGLTGAGVSLSFPTIKTARDAARLAEDVFSLPARLRRSWAAGWSSPSTSSRPSRLSTAAPWSSRCARPSSSSGRSAMSSPALSRA